MGDILLPLPLLLSQLRKGAQVAVPVVQDVPVALRKHGKGLGRLPIGGKQVCRAFLIDLLLGIGTVSKDADQQRQQHPCYEQYIFSFVLHKVNSPRLPRSQTPSQYVLPKALCQSAVHKVPQKCTSAACQLPYKPTLSLITLYHFAKKPVNTSMGRFVSFQRRFTQSCPAFAAQKGKKRPAGRA